MNNASAQTIPFRARVALGAAALVALTATAYSPLVSAGFIWDDDDYVEKNPALRSLAGLKSIWVDLGATPQYYPLVFTSFWVEYQLWGDDPTGYHLVNVVLHALNAVLVWQILSRLGVRGGWLAAAVFALHPVHVESVAWISERKNLLSGAFYLAAALVYLRLDERRDATDRPARAVALYTMSLLLFGCALLSKTITASLPLGLLLLGWWQRGRVGRNDLLRSLPFVALGLAAGLLTVWIERYHVGATGPAWQHSAIERLLVAGRAWWFYAEKLVWPHGLTFIYPRWQIDTSVWGQYLYPLSALAVLVGLWLARGRIGRGPAVAVAFFTVTLLPALGFFDVYPMRYSFVADHCQYLASLGPIVLLAASLRSAVGQMGGRTGVGILVAAGGLLVAFGGLSWNRSLTYVDRERLWRDTVGKNPDAWICHHNLGLAVADKGRFKEAIRHYRSALEIRPDASLSHFNLALAARRTGLTDLAAKHLQHAVDLKPNWPVALNELAWLLATSPDPGSRDGPRAVELARRANELTDGRDPVILDTLAAALAAVGEFDQAVTAAETALSYLPDGRPTHVRKPISHRLWLYQHQRTYRERLVVPAPSGNSD